MTEYRKELALSGDPAAVLSHAKAWLAGLGYRITASSETTVAAERPAGLLWSTSAQPIFGASPIGIETRFGRLTVSAGFSGIESLRRFLVRLLVGLAVTLGAVLGVTFSLVFDETWPALLGVGLGVGIPLLQLPVHLLMTVPILRRRAVQSLDVLTENLVRLSE